MDEYIKHAAVKTTTGEIITGKRHLECRDKIKEFGLIASNDPYHEGFLTNTDRFVNRLEAARIAYKAGQIENKELVLISEMLWNKAYGGRCNYDEEIGFY